MTGGIVPARVGRALSRREALGLLGGGAMALLLAACGAGAANQGAAPAPSTAPPAPPMPTSATDFSARFADFTAADEPEGDPSKVVWPDFVTKAGPEIQQLYAFQVTNGALMRYMPCFCGCQSVDGHRNNRDCYIDRVNPDGTVVFDSMAPTWGVCLDVTRAVMKMKAEGMTPRAIRAAIDAAYAPMIDRATPTPYPPS